MSDVEEYFRRNLREEFGMTRLAPISNSRQRVIGALVRAHATGATPTLGEIVADARSSLAEVAGIIFELEETGQAEIRIVPKLAWTPAGELQP